VFHGVVSEEVDCCVGGGWFSVYVNFQICLFNCYCQVKEVYRPVAFMCGVQFYVITYLN
jgi:hypothetical protein